MSMPTFPPANTILTREQALNAILASIAMEEAALSHIIKAEGKKIQYAIQYAKCHDEHDNLRILLDINRSADSLIDKLKELEIILEKKMKLALKNLSIPACRDLPACKDLPACPHHKPCPPEPLCPCIKPRPCLPMPRPKCRPCPNCTKYFE